MGKRSSNSKIKTRVSAPVKKEPIVNNPPPKIEPADTKAIDLSTVIDQSKANLINEKPKRHRRTREEIEADRLRAGGQQPPHAQVNPTMQIPNPNRVEEIKAALMVYSEILLAKPLQIDELKFSDTEAQSIAMVSNNLMNTFPEYFNSSNPKVSAIVGAVVVAAPIGYMKYSIYKKVMTERKKAKLKQSQPDTKVEVTQQKQSGDINLASGNPFEVSQ